MNILSKYSNYAGKTIAIRVDNDEVIATAKERRSLKYDKSIPVYILVIPEQKIQSKQITRIAIVLDESSSMDSIREKTVTVFNSIIQSIQENSEKNNQETTLSFFTFSNSTRQVYKNNPINKIMPLSYSNFKPSGWTALLDSIAEATLQFKNSVEKEEVSYLIYVVTDGEENWSKRFTKESLSKLIRECTDAKNYTFTVSVPRGQKTITSNKLGIPLDNIIEWEATDKGITELGEVTTSAMSGYYTARAGGSRAVQNFFVNTDLSKVKQSDLNKLEDISSQVKIVEVKKESVIKDFVESNTKRPYVIGQGYYQLTKKELVQPGKSVVLFDKKTKCVYGGKGARKLIGLVDGVNCKVNPLDHSHYEIFIKSTSVNRKLPSYSKVLIDINKLTNDKPTWE